jgi:hypothetical protein
LQRSDGGRARFDDSPPPRTVHSAFSRSNADRHRPRARGRRELLSDRSPAP